MRRTLHRSYHSALMPTSLVHTHIQPIHKPTPVRSVDPPSRLTTPTQPPIRSFTRQPINPPTNPSTRIAAAHTPDRRPIPARRPPSLLLNTRACPPPLIRVNAIFHRSRIFSAFSSRITPYHVTARPPPADRTDRTAVTSGPPCRGWIELHSTVPTCLRFRVRVCVNLGSDA